MTGKWWLESCEGMVGVLEEWRDKAAGMVGVLEAG